MLRKSPWLRSPGCPTERHGSSRRSGRRRSLAVRARRAPGRLPLPSSPQPTASPGRLCRPLSVPSRTVCRCPSTWPRSYSLATGSRRRRKRKQYLYSPRRARAGFTLNRALFRKKCGAPGPLIQ